MDPDPARPRPHLGFPATESGARWERWARVKEVFLQALDHDLADRIAFVHRACGNDGELHREVMSLLSNERAATEFGETPAACLLGIDLRSEVPAPRLEPGARLGAYVISHFHSAGGMGEVYRARHVVLDRVVAIKTVRGALADGDAGRRLMREARHASQLSHPNICTIHEVGEDEGTPFIVMEFVEGASLSSILRGGHPPDLLNIGLQLCSALAHAHERSIVHRDLKSSNIVVAADGRLVVLDFGLAQRLRAHDSVASEESTVTGDRPLAGTLSYMAPEVLHGGYADARSDIWSLGVVLYELATGTLPFTGRTPFETSSAIMREPPPPMPQEVPLVLRLIIARCLVKDPAARYQRASDVAAALHAFRQRRAWPLIGRLMVSARRRTLYAAGGGVVMLAAGTAGISRVRDYIAEARRDLPMMVLGKATQVTAEAGLEIHPAISPDGQRLAYAAGNSQHTRIVTRPLAGGRPSALVDGDGPQQANPRWSPDGTQILFLAADGVHVAPAAGGATRQIVGGRVQAPVSAADWSPDGREIAFVRGDTLFVRALGGGAPRVLYVSRANWLHSCAWAPSGRHIACVSGNYEFVKTGRRFGNLAPSQLLVIPAAGGDAIAVTDGSVLNQSPAWSADGAQLYFVSNHQGPRDIYMLPMSADGQPRAEATRLSTGLGAQSVTLSRDGRHLAYASYTAWGNMWSVPVPATPPASTAEASPLTSGTQVIEAMRVSRDGRWLYYSSDLRGNSDIYRLALTGGEPEQLTTDPAEEFAPDLSPDGATFAHHSFQTGSRDIVIRTLDGKFVKLITNSPRQESTPHWSPDGQALVLWNQAPFNMVEIMRRSRDGTWGSPVPVVNDVEFPSWSPNGQLLLGTHRIAKAVVVIRPDNGEMRTLYAPKPGTADPPVERVEWSPDGRSIFFKSLDATGQASIWVLPSTGGRPRLLVRFDDPSRPSSRPDFATDGRRFYFTIEDRRSDISVAEVIRR